MSDPGPSVRERVDAIEEGYEFFLAYAARGVKGDGESGPGSELRAFLSRVLAATDGLAAALRLAVREAARERKMDEEGWEEFTQVVERDAEATRAALRLVSAQPSVSSQLIDNLNANVHFRALLTDLFLVDELLHPG